MSNAYLHLRSNPVDEPYRCHMPIRGLMIALVLSSIFWALLILAVLQLIGGR